MNEVQLAWASGFFDGEGSTVSNKSSIRLNIGQTQTNVAVLHKFQTVVGLGKVKGPYDSSMGRPYYQYYVSGMNAVDVLLKLWPHLSEMKKIQAKIALSRVIKATVRVRRLRLFKEKLYDTILNAAEAVDLGLADEILGEPTE